MSSEHTRLGGACLAALLFGGLACAGETPIEQQPRQVRVWNRCTSSAEEPNFYALQEIYNHSSRSWSGSTNLIDAPLAVGAEIVLRINHHTYVTVVRQRNLGQRIALTTGEPLDLNLRCNLLEVFDDGFRLSQDEARCFDPMDDGPPGGDADPGDPGPGDPGPGD